MADAKKSVPYGYCPICGKIGISRERRKDGNDKCADGHVYPSSIAESLVLPTRLDDIAFLAQQACRHKWSSDRLTTELRDMFENKVAIERDRERSRLNEMIRTVHDLSKKLHGTIRSHFEHQSQ